MIHLDGHGMKCVLIKFRSILIIPVRRRSSIFTKLAIPYVQAKAPCAQQLHNNNLLTVVDYVVLSRYSIGKVFCRFGALRKAGCRLWVGPKLWSAWRARAMLLRRIRAVLARRAVPEEPEPCSPKEPYPKSKSRARVVLADDPEPCLPEQPERRAGADRHISERTS